MKGTYAGRERGEEGWREREKDEGSVERNRKLG